MSEIEKLRKRLSNVGRNVVEYRMTVDEARTILREIDEMKIELQKKPPEMIVDTPVNISRTIDGGTL